MSDHLRRVKLLRSSQPPFVVPAISLAGDIESRRSGIDFCPCCGFLVELFYLSRYMLGSEVAATGGGLG